MTQNAHPKRAATRPIHGTAESYLAKKERATRIKNDAVKVKKHTAPQKDAACINLATRIFQKFGTVKHLCEVLALIGRPRNINSLYKWQYPRWRGGMAGFIPHRAIADVLAAARFDGILITPEELDPRTYVTQIERWGMRRLLTPRHLWKPKNKAKS